MKISYLRFPKKIHRLSPKRKQTVLASKAKYYQVLEDGNKQLDSTGYVIMSFDDLENWVNETRCFVGR